MLLHRTQLRIEHLLLLVFITSFEVATRTNAFSTLCQETAVIAKRPSVEWPHHPNGFHFLTPGRRQIDVLFNLTYKGKEGLLSHRTNTLDNGRGPCGCRQTTATMWLWWLDPGIPIYTAVRERFNT